MQYRKNIEKKREEMHRRAVACDTCGKHYFPASLPHHQRQCVRYKWVTCLHCREPVRYSYSAAASPPPFLTPPRRRLERQEEHMRNECHEIMKARWISISRPHEPLPLTTRPGRFDSFRARRREKEQRSAPEQQQTIGEPEEDGRVACNVCSRCFAPERILQHQSICSGVRSPVHRDHRPRSAPPHAPLLGHVPCPPPAHVSCSPRRLRPSH